MITFIIPTINRKSLQRSIDCLIAQTNKEWKAIVIFDGVPIATYHDPRIKSIKINKVGKLNYAGYVRNYGIKEVETEWIGLLDDDDTISENYVEKFKEEINTNPDAKCIIFRMKTNFDVDKILPAQHHKNFIKNKVGISFAFKKDLNLLFEPSATEDFDFLNRIRENNHKMIISPYITYFVRDNPQTVPALDRIKINY